MIKNNLFKIYVSTTILIIIVIGILTSYLWTQYSLNLNKERLYNILIIKKNAVEEFIEHKRTEHKTPYPAIISELESKFSDQDEKNSFGKTGEFVLARKNEGEVKFYSKNMYQCDEPPRKLKASSAVVRALEGETGFIKDIDYLGKTVYAAYAPIDTGLGIGLAAKINFDEIISPAYNACIFIGVVVVLLCVIISIFFYKYNKKFIRELSENEKEFRIFSKIMDSTQELISYVDKNLRYAAVSKSYLDTLELTKEDIIGHSLIEFFGKEKFNKDVKERLLKAFDGEIINYQEMFIYPAKGQRFVDVTYAPHFVDGKVEGVVALSKDITELYNAQKEIIESRENLKKINTELEDRVKNEIKDKLEKERIIFEQKKFTDMGQMLNAIAHQWRQPLNALGLYIQSAVFTFKDRKMDDEFADEFNKTCKNLIGHMSKTIDDFKDFFNPKSEEECFELVEAVKSTISLVDSQLKNDGINIKICCDCGGDKKYIDNYNEDLQDFYGCKPNATSVKGYKSELKQVILNLIQNARESIKQKGCKGSINIDILSQGEFIKLTVSDNGVGIPDDIIKRIFDPYFTTKHDIKGTGIGLYMSKIIIEEHMKGKITAFSNNGAVFRISLQKADK